MGPELPRQIELDIDLQGLGDVDRAVGRLGRVVQLAVRRVAGAGVVPALRTFERAILQAFDTATLSAGSSAFSSVPTVALMMPAPIKATSTEGGRATGFIGSSPDQRPIG
jgi:hypothetical protein